MSRTIAIGDIHGCSIALQALIGAISPQPDDTIIPLGDYVDRGIDSKGVLDQLILESCRSYFETDTHIFLHANYKPDVPLEQLDDNTIRWLSLRDEVPARPHCSWKVVVVGHTPHTEVLDLGFLICLDTGVWKGGWLTALDVESGTTWQVNETGALR